MHGSASGPTLPTVASPPACSWGDSPSTSAHAPPLPAPDFTPLPEVGGEFLGFRLIAELGRGSFGRVFLGRQPDLSDRLVALKVSTEVLTESRKLARLQHTNIVPVYSVHRAGPLQAVCMPYYGSATLADVLSNIGQRQTLPASGGGLISTLEECRTRTRAEIVRAPSGEPPARPEESSTGLRRLSELTHVEAILWIAACLADGLAHAHSHGIVHRDLKPANVLLTDDGTPMLLDFNLAGDSLRPGGRVGGTLAYMAPEHLAAFVGMRLYDRPPVVDHRSDLFGLGVILFELLTGRHPFPRKHEGFEPAVVSMITDRLARPPRLRPHNRALTPAVEAIVRHCLHPDPTRRYQSAEHLRDDLLNQLEHQPLRHAGDPSAVERARKWARRHPRLASWTTAAVAGGA
ncbi:MAG: serine/threonine-protein kinase, partial [Gemmataceae bacterium]